MVFPILQKGETEAQGGEGICLRSHRVTGGVETLPLSFPFLAQGYNNRLWSWAAQRNVRPSLGLGNISYCSSGHTGLHMAWI